MFSFKGCGACEAMYPTLRKVQEMFSSSGLSILGVMVDETADTVREAVLAKDITWRCVWDGPSGPIAKMYDVQGYPTVFLIGGDGRIKSDRLRREDELVANIEKAIHEQSAK
jgi:thiol-disulfide isomerase/thioredoxin